MRKIEILLKNAQGLKLPSRSNFEVIDVSSGLQQSIYGGTTNNHCTSGTNSGCSNFQCETGNMTNNGCSNTNCCENHQ